MTLDKADELLAVQVDMGGGYNRNAARLILAEVQQDHGQTAVDALIEKYNMEELFGLKPGTVFNKPDSTKF